MPEVHAEIHVMTNNNYLLVPLHDASQEKILRLRDPQSFIQKELLLQRRRFLESFPFVYSFMNSI